MPPVQKLAVDKAAEILSEEMGMEVTVADVNLRFPLNLAMGGMLAVQDGDTVLAARRLDICVQALPLLKLQAEVDGIHLYDTRLNTKDLIESAMVQGQVAEISLDCHSADLKKELAVINKALLRDADLTVTMADSVPEDTATSDVKWKIQVDDLECRNVKATLRLAPPTDSTFVMVNIVEGHATAFIDLGEEVYRIDRLDVSKSEAAFCVESDPRLPDQLDPSHLLFGDVSLQVDTFVYKGTGELTANVTHLSGREQSGLEIAEAATRIEMDTLQLLLPRLRVKTADSNVELRYRMDISAFDEVEPGEFELNAVGLLGKDDIIFFTRMSGEDSKPVCAMLSDFLPARPAEVRMSASGNLQTLDVSQLHVNIPNKLQAKGKAVMYDVAENLSMKTELDLRDEMGAAAEIEAGYAMVSDAYNADVKFRNLVLNNYAGLDDHVFLTGFLSARGQGFDFTSEGTVLNASARLDTASVGKIDLSNIDADVTLEGHLLQLSMTGDNRQMQTDLTFDGTLKKNLIEGELNINIPFIDAQDMGFSDDELQASTKGTAHISYNLDNLFRVDSHIDSMNLLLGNERIVTDPFSLFAEALKDTTSATLHTGDLDFYFFTPNNIMSLMPKMEKLQRETLKQFKEHDVNLNVLKTYLPELSIHATAGQHNPVSDVLKTYGVQFDEFVADAEISPETGLLASGHLHSLKKENVRVDTASFSVCQDTTQIDYRVDLKCNDQPLLPAFRATLDGFIMADRACAHLVYFDKRERKGIDVGVRAVATDTCVNYSIFPDRPVLGYREFALNADHYIITRPDRPVQADVRLESTTDSCYVAFLADESELHRQIANFVANNLNLNELLSVVPIPGMPNLGGIVSVDATYVDEGDNFLVNGTWNADRFTYEGAAVGDLSSLFTYTPQGKDLHKLDANLACNGTDIIVLDGIYDASGTGALNADLSLMDVPLSLVSPLVPDQTVAFSGTLTGGMKIEGPTDSLRFNGSLMPRDVHAVSNLYSLDLRLANDTIRCTDSRLDLDSLKIYAVDDNPLTLNGHVDFSNLDEVFMSLSLSGRNFKVMESPRANGKLLFGNMYGNFFARVIGTTNDLTVRGLVNVLPTTNMTYIMSETMLYQTDRLEDIVTFVDFSAPPPPKESIAPKTYMGIDMNIVLNVQEGARLNAEFSADKQSYVNVQGGGAITMSYTPEGVFNMQGRYTINEGEMKYTLPVIPLKTFSIHSGSYIEFDGSPSNPLLNLTATERIKATVGQGGSSRSVPFDVGLKITNSLQNLGLEFVIDAPDDITVQNELASSSAEDRNKLAVGMLATGMYLSGSNSRGLAASNALNSFLEEEINNIAGNALSTMVNVSVGYDETVRTDGSKRTDYSFKFSRKFFSDRLNVVIGGKVSSDTNQAASESGAYIDDVSLEWRLDNGGTQYIRLFHEKDFSNLIEGEIDKNGAGVVLRRKVDRLSELIFWRKKEKEK